MVSKPKKRQVLKAHSETPEPPKSQAKHDKPTQVEALIRYNGNLIQGLFINPGWVEIAFPLLQELIAGVSGRFTNGRFYHGTLTRDFSGNSTIFSAGYQKGLMDFYNGLDDFLVTMEKQVNAKKQEKEEGEAKVYNPFMEELDA